MRLLKLSLLVLVLSVTSHAFANTFYFSGGASNTFNPGYGGITVNGSFTATPDFSGNAGVWQVQTVTGTVIDNNGVSHMITGVVPAPGITPGNPYDSADGYLYNDLYYSTTAVTYGPYATSNSFDYYGLLFGTADGDFVNLFMNYNPATGAAAPVYATNFFAYGNNAYFQSAPVTASVTPALTSIVSSTPEPSSLVLLGTGALGVAGAIRRRMTNKLA